MNISKLGTSFNIIYVFFVLVSAWGCPTFSQTRELEPKLSQDKFTKRPSFQTIEKKEIHAPSDLRSRLLQEKINKSTFDPSSSFKNGGVRGGGGDDIDQEFKNTAEKIFHSISKIDFYQKTLGTKKLTELEFAINNAIVASVDYPLVVEITTANGNKLLLPRAARCTVNKETGDMLIEVDETHFTRLSTLKKHRLIFHEYLCLVDVEGTNQYQYSNHLYKDSVLLPSLADLGLVAQSLDNFSMPRFQTENCIIRFHQTLHEVWLARNNQEKPAALDLGLRLRAQMEQCMNVYIQMESRNLATGNRSIENEIERLSFLTRLTQFHFLIFLNSKLMQEFPQFNRLAAMDKLIEQEEQKKQTLELVQIALRDITDHLDTQQISQKDKVRLNIVKSWLEFIQEQPVFEN